MKAYTDIEQSKKLAEILPIESADMFYVYDRHLDRFYGDTPYVGYRVLNIDVDMPCWSLAALLGVIPDVSLNSFKDGDWNAMVQHDGKMIYGDKDNPVDACYEMILKLNKVNLL